MIKTIIERLQEQTWEKQLDQDWFEGEDDIYTTTILLKNDKVNVELSTTKYEEGKLEWSSVAIGGVARIYIHGEGETFEQHISSLISQLKQTNENRVIETVIERLQEQTWEKQLDQDRYNGKDDKFTTTILLKDGKVEVELSTTKYEEDKLKWASLKVNVDDANIDIFGEGETFEQHISSLISKLKQLGGITWG